MEFKAYNISFHGSGKKKRKAGGRKNEMKRRWSQDILLLLFFCVDINLESMAGNFKAHVEIKSSRYK